MVLKRLKSTRPKNKGPNSVKVFAHSPCMSDAWLLLYAVIIDIDVLCMLNICTAICAVVGGERTYDHVAMSLVSFHRPEC
jgi:hypothetical protein